MKTKTEFEATDKPEENNHSEENHKPLTTRIYETFKDWLPVLIGVSFGITFFNIENINIFFNHYTHVVSTNEDNTAGMKTEVLSDDKAESHDVHAIVSEDANVPVNTTPKDTTPKNQKKKAKQNAVKKTQPKPVPPKPKPKPEPEPKPVTPTPAPKPPIPAITSITPAAKTIWKLESTGTGNSLGITLYMGSSSLAGKNTKSRSDDPRNHFTFSISNAQNGQVCKVSSNVEVKSVKGGKRNGDTITFSGGSAEISAVRKW
ncbi:MAG: hypothetical protein IJS42_03095 [Synergistaceae bacterium]|nr:hypothetical protein [Synergistaceae bacterium]